MHACPEAAEGNLFLGGGGGGGGGRVIICALEFFAAPTLQCSEFTRAFVCVQ